MKLDPETLDASIQEWEALLDGACHQTLDAADHGKLREVVKTMGRWRGCWPTRMQRCGNCDGCC
jgi:hypothetical protein